MGIENNFLITVAGRNVENWIETNLNSILCQTYKNYRVIYINDASTDNTEILYNNIVRNNSKFTYIKNLTRQPVKRIDLMEDIKYSEDPNTIVIELDADDWIATETVLEQYNDFYNKNDCWITYGKMLVWDGSDRLTEANPQNSPYPDFVKDNNLYRLDVWRASHLRTYRYFLRKNIKKDDLTSNITNEYFEHAGDLAITFQLMEMCPSNKVLPVDFVSVVWNAHPSKMHLTRERESSKNFVFENEIRFERKRFKKVKTKEELNGEKLPLINVFGAFCENNSIPSKFSYCYNLEKGDFDITAFHDLSILDYLNGKIKISHGKIVAELTESPFILKTPELYDIVYNNYEKFDLILTYNDRILTLPNSKFRVAGGETVLNKNIHLKTYPELADESLIKIYPKNKNMSMISSNKNMCEGHYFRLKCLNSIINNSKNVDIYGIGINPIKGKIEGLKDYRFSITVENCSFKNYFTEKILDCFLTGTIPIYHGCPNIGDFFNLDGFYTFELENELLNIVDSINEFDYNKKIDIINENFKLALNLRHNNDIYFDKYFKQLL